MWSMCICISICHVCDAHNISANLRIQPVLPVDLCSNQFLKLLIGSRVFWHVFFLIFMCTMWNTPFLILGLPFSSDYHPHSLISPSQLLIYHFPLTNFWMQIFLNFYVVASVIPLNIFFLAWILLYSRPIYLTAYYPVNYFLALKLNMPYGTAASKMVLMIHASLCSYPFAVLSHIKLCWP